jgi:hypothetical protein
VNFKSFQLPKTFFFSHLTAMRLHEQVLKILAIWIKALGRCTEAEHFFAVLLPTEISFVNP